jgi:preprotein translocase subunit SecD
MAGIIAAIGVGVDAQIVITDELLKKTSGTQQERLENAFGIITTNVTVAIFAMVPLLFSGMVEIIGFAISTILGALLGLLISRPSYAALVQNISEE